jgi:hypothetical protein
MKVFKYLSIALLLAAGGFITSTTALAQAIALTGTDNGLYNTGIDSSGNVITPESGDVDPHYTVVSDVTSGGDPGTFVTTPAPTYAGPLFTGAGASFPPWPTSATATNITLNPTDNTASTDVFTYELTLTNIPTGSLVTISGNISADDSVSIFADGTQFYSDYSSFHTLDPFTLSFTSNGTDTLDFAVNNSGSLATGLLVDSLIGSYELAPVPESSEYAAAVILLMLGLIVGQRQIRRMQGNGLVA